ncbi:arylsulfatase A family protein [gamma proteobacterium HIMB55]|nr:arylsulfatase A family protein [gamma proteobacterium HIMB55]
MRVQRPLLFLMTLLSLVIPHHTLSAEERPPNIIFVILDDLRFDGMGFLTPEVKTPNIDQLAEDGTYFPNAVVTTSLCSPSRATILTGMTTQNHRIVDNNNTSEAGLTFFPKYLQAAGYETGFFGKWHMGESNDSPRDGFDRWVSFAGQGSYYPIKRPDGSTNVINVDGQRVPQQGYITDEITEYALTWLEEQRDATKPFFLYLSHKAVHSDAVPAPRHRGQYDDVTFELPSSVEITDAYLEGKPMWVKNQRNSWHGIDFAYASDRKMTDYLKDYFGALSSVDDSIGTLRAYLSEADIAENTVIIFYSDNGFLTGDHGLIDKRNAYEGSIRVPMIVAAPGRVPAGAVNDTRIRNLDLAPTFLGAAAVQAPAHFEGKDAWPLMTGSQSRRQWGEPDFVYQYYWEWSFPMTPTTLAIVRDGLKYIQYHGVWDIEELYDLNADPLELTNLINHPDYYHQRQALRKALYAQAQGPSGQNAIPYTPRLAEGMNLRDKDGPKVAPFPASWLVAPNRQDKFNGLIPDIPAKKAAMDQGKIFIPWLLSKEEQKAAQQEMNQ